MAVGRLLPLQSAVTATVVDGHSCCRSDSAIELASLPAHPVQSFLSCSQGSVVAATVAASCLHEPHYGGLPT